MEQAIWIWLVRLALAGSAGFAFGSSAYLLASAAIDGRRVRRRSVLQLIRKIWLACMLGATLAAIGMAMARG